jgi:signal transduction histidine kinase
MLVNKMRLAAASVALRKLATGPFIPVVVSALLAVVVAAAIGIETHWPQLYGWLAAVLLVSLWRLWGCVQRSSPEAEEGWTAMPLPWHWGLGAVANGLLWGGLAAWLAYRQDVSGHALVCVVIAGLSGGAVASYFTRPVLVDAFTWSALVPMIASTAYWGGPRHLALALCAVAFGLAVSLYARRINVWMQEKDRLLRRYAAANERAEKASRAKSEFLARMSHELRTPLNAVLGFSEVIRDRTFGDTAIQRYADYAASIHVSGRHLLDLINAVLDLSKIEAGKLELHESVIDLVAQARGAMALVEPQSAGKQLRIRLDAPSSLLLYADPVAINQVFLNLLSNAVKFTAQGGLISVQLRLEAGAGAKFVVSDTGVGIAPADLAGVFESFSQGRHSPRIASERGTGLGLAIVKGLVEAHGGTVAIESELGRGTSVRVALPATRLVTRPQPMVA